MLALRLALSEHYWLIYGTLGAFVCLAVLTEAWLARRRETKAAEKISTEAINTELGKTRTIYALPPHVGELGKPILFDWCALERGIKEISGWKEGPNFIVPNRPFISTAITHKEDNTHTIRHKRRKASKKKKSTKRKKK